MSHHRIPNRSGLKVALCLLTISSVGILSGCTEDMSDLRSYVSKVNARPGGHIEPLPEMRPFETYIYPEDQSGNPFQRLSFAEPQPEPTVADTGPRPDPSRPHEALEDFTLDSLAYVGTLERGDQSWALVKDPGGIVHRVQTGNYVGKNYGRIEKITPNTIKVRELIPKESGGWIEREAALALND
jgi:type IV pilus assembly protein PilP